MDLLTATVAERPDLAQLLDDFNPWPRFMHQDPVGSLYYADPVGMYPEFVQVAIDRDHPGQLVAKSYSVPFTWDADPAVSLPGDGWDGAILSAALDRLAGRRGNLISALEISIRKDLQGSGLSRDHARRDAGERGRVGVHQPGRARAAEPEAPPADNVHCGVRCPDAAPTACRPTPGCGRTSGPAGQSSASRRER